jgi:hypothetical protein
MKHILAGLVLLLSGCASYTLVEQERVTICKLYSVEPGIQWSELKQGDVRLWTVNSVDLESIRFISGIREGVPVIDISKEEHRTSFRPDMTETELVEAIVDGFSLSGAQRVEAKNLRPAPFGTLEGFRFELEFLSDKGLKKQGAVIGTVVDESLYLIIYTGAAMHYFPKYHDEFEAIIRSIKVQNSALQSS